jgi:alpha-D-ribose 1-methylphosphonate 5-triphosphate synthase subunit PhnG
MSQIIPVYLGKHRAKSEQYCLRTKVKPKIYKTRQSVVTSWNAIGHALQAQGKDKLSAEVKAFVQALPESLGVGEQLEKQLRSQLDKQKHKDKGSER